MKASLKTKIFAVILSVALLETSFPHNFVIEPVDATENTMEQCMPANTHHLKDCIHNSTTEHNEDKCNDANECIHHCTEHTDHVEIDILSLIPSINKIKLSLPDKGLRIKNSGIPPDVPPPKDSNYLINNLNL